MKTEKTVKTKAEFPARIQLSKDGPKLLLFLDATSPLTYRLETTAPQWVIYAKPTELAHQQLAQIGIASDCLLKAGQIVHDNPILKVDTITLVGRRVKVSMIRCRKTA